MARKPGTWLEPSKRKRKTTAFTLSDAADEALDELAERSGDSRSAIVEAMILRAHARLPKIDTPPDDDR